MGRHEEKWFLYLIVAFVSLGSCDNNDLVELGKNSLEAIGFDRTSEVVDYNEHDLYFSWETSKHWTVTNYSEIIGEDTTKYKVDSCNCNVLWNDTTRGDWFYAMIKNGKFYVKLFENSSPADRELILGMSGSETGGRISIFQEGKK